jgi:hypothetical protein
MCYFTVQTLEYLVAVRQKAGIGRVMENGEDEEETQAERMDG